MDRNNRYIEEHLPDYVKEKTHLNLRYLDTDGDGERDKIAVVSPELPSDMALTFFGMNEVGALITKARMGRIEPKEFAVELLKNMGVSAGDTMYDLLNPIMKMVPEIVANYDSWTRKPIVPDDSKGLSDYEKLKSFWMPYMAKQLMPPINNMLMAARDNDPIWKQFGERQKFWQALGYKMFDPYKQESIDEAELKNKITSKVDSAISRIQFEYTHSPMSLPEFRESDFYQEKINELKEDGFPVEPRILDRLLTNSYVKQDKLEWMLERAKTNEEKQKINSQLEVERRINKVLSIKNDPRDIRKEIIDGINKLRESRSQWTE